VEAYKGTQKNLRSFANLEKVEKERALIKLWMPMPQSYLKLINYYVLMSFM